MDLSKEEQLYIINDILVEEILFRRDCIVAPTQEEKEVLLRKICKNRGFDYDRLFR